MNVELVQSLLEEFRDMINTYEDSVKREASLPKVTNKILVTIGMRRTGKTYFLLQYITDLLKNGIPLNRILYVNFEDERLYPLTQDKLGKLIDAFYTLYPDNHDNICYLFLDEIQNVENWQVTIRRFFDTKKVRIFLTGSSAKLLSKEIATSLRGRSLSTEIWPYSFSEFLLAIKADVIKQPFGKKSLDKLTSQFHHYLEYGGFPEIVNYEHRDRINTLQDYVNVVIFKDIVERYNITNINLIRYLIKIFIKNAGTSFSVNKQFNDLKSQGFALSKMTIHEYLGYIEDAYLAFTVPLYSESIRKTQTNPKKIYAIDTGLINAYNLSFTKNMGHIFENLIFLDLKRKGHEIYYYLTKNRNEVDFLSKDSYGKMHLFQVAWDVSDPETMEREIRALSEAEKELNIKGKLITPSNYLSDFVEQMQSKE